MVSRAFSYIRFSSKKQHKGESLRRQSEFAFEMPREIDLGLDESLTLNDLGVSAFQGANAKVGALGECLEALRIGRIPKGSILIIEIIDRLGRDKVGEALQLFIPILNTGVWIVTREPRRTYTQNSINDIAALLEPLIYMSRAHEESATKSFRLRDAWAKKKERAAQGSPMTKMAPRWLELTEEGYRLIPERAETVRSIFRMSAEGLGASESSSTCSPIRRNTRPSGIRAVGGIPTCSRSFPTGRCSACSSRECGTRGVRNSIAGSRPGRSLALRQLYDSH